MSSNKIIQHTSLGRLAIVLIGLSVSLAQTACASSNATIKPRTMPAPSAGGEALVVAPSPAPAEPSDAERAASREREMYVKMDRAVQDIAQLYGNPRFVRTMSNDPDLAAEFKARIQATRDTESIRAEVADLTQRREALKDEVALLEREAEAAKAKLARTRATLDAVQTTLGQATRTIESSAE